MQTLQNQTLAAFNDNTFLKKVLDSQQQSSFLDEQASLLSPTLDTTVKLKEDIGKTDVSLAPNSIKIKSRV